MVKSLHYSEDKLYKESVFKDGKFELINGIKTYVVEKGQGKTMMNGFL